jgi:hypothetical protein
MIQIVLTGHGLNTEDEIYARFKMNALSLQFREESAAATLAMDPTQLVGVA